jgi:hypothetical protein
VKSPARIREAHHAKRDTVRKTIADPARKTTSSARSKLLSLASTSTRLPRHARRMTRNAAVLRASWSSFAPHDRSGTPKTRRPASTRTWFAGSRPAWWPSTRIPIILRRATSTEDLPGITRTGTGRIGASRALSATPMVPSLPSPNAPGLGRMTRTDYDGAALNDVAAIPTVASQTMDAAMHFSRFRLGIYSRLTLESAPDCLLINGRKPT